MSKRRMFSLDIVDNDVFLDMPQTSQLLYFHLSMRADDYGFITPRKVMRMVGANHDDLQVLIAKRYVLAFDSGVVAIKHWPVNNTVRKDRSHDTTFAAEFESLIRNEFGAYTERRKILEAIEGVEKHATLHSDKNLSADKWQPHDNQMTTEIRLDYITTEFNKLNSREPDKPDSQAINVTELLKTLIKKLGHNDQTKITDGRKRKLKVRLKTYTPEEILTAALNLTSDGFMQGDNDAGKKYGTIDYFLRSDEVIDKWLNTEHGTSKENIKELLRNATI